MAARADVVDELLPARRRCAQHRRAGSGSRRRYTYDPGNPTPYLVDARELELSINENYQAVHAERKTC